MFESGVLTKPPTALHAVASRAARLRACEPQAPTPLQAIAPLPAHRDEPEEACERIAAMAPGAALAALIEELLSPLLVPAASPAGPADSCDGAVDLAAGLPAGPAADAAAASPEPEAGIAEQAADLAVLPSDMIQDSGLLALGAEGLSELVAACHRLGSWATWAESMAAACLAQSPEFRTGPAPWGPEGAVPRFVTPEENRFTTSSEIACRLGISRTCAARILERGEALMNPLLGPTEALHRSGLLDGAKAALVVGRLDGAAAHTALAIQDEVLPRAPRRTHAQLARDLDRALVAHDPEGASRRRRHNVRARHVSRPRPAGEGVCRMTLLMPTLDAFLLDATLDAIAASARAAGDGRTLAQLRADALTAMTLTTLRTSQNAACAPGGPEPQAGPARPGRPEPPGTAKHPERPAPPGEEARVQGRLRGGEQDRAGAPEHLGAAAGMPLADALCPVPDAHPAPGRFPMPDGVPLEGLLVSLSGLMSSTSPWWMPSGEQALHLPPGLRVRVDVTVPLDHLLPHTDTDPDAPDPGTGVGASASASHDRGADPGSGPPPGAVAHPADAAGTPPAPVAADPAMGPAATGAAHAAAPVAEIVIGSRRSPIPARVARALAAGGTWRRLVTDPLTGAVLDAGRRRYRPAQDLAERVRLRDRSCTHPGCEVPARRCDLDHITPWSAGGVTSMDNLTALCEAHHRLKHTPGWSLSRAPEGALTWRTPTGARYRRQADGTIRLLPRRLGPHSHQHQGTAVPAPLSQEITAPLLERLERGLASTHPAQAPTATAGLDRVAILETRGPGPGQRAGAFETADYPPAAHLLGLAPLLDAAPPF
ncbi:HNH endonuclease [Actinomyces bowdenii]|uniref:HNH endonuclease n=1 Tax=Actinomyces bowdenii TaxID=131109 RepID=A0A3P1V4P0_9ACTO|nr:HNH endonuclease signature motif containing protein [Actinomyces bowdenii]RRD29101.1 HNH endonuclease [Actinomyces bowdenii]